MLPTYLRAPGMSVLTTLFILIGIAVCGFTRGCFNSTLGGLLLDLCLGVVGAVAAGLAVQLLHRGGQRTNLYCERLGCDFRGGPAARLMPRSTLGRGIPTARWPADR
jgi:uncharacterized membrane protein YeaQ/YmgE (transglycosylase-associated protein family)